MSKKLQDVRITASVAQVLRPFLDNPKRAISGADIIRETRMFSGTLYPILIRLENAGWLTSTWESIDPIEEGRPRRRLYTVTASGQQLALEALAEHRERRGEFKWI